MLNFGEILETVNMVREEHFDVRTITLGLNLLGSVRETAEKTADAVYDHICRTAGGIVKVAEDLELKYGIPIVNKRISITPASFLTQNSLRARFGLQVRFIRVCLLRPFPH